MIHQPYVCGWDGGGTKTHVLCLTPEGRQAGEGSFGPLNLNGAEKEKIVATIRESVAFMASLPGGLDACQGLVIGTAGISNSAAAALVTETVRRCGYAGPLRLLGDQEIALAGAIDGPGAVLVAGTGAICCGRDAAGRVTRVGGYGYLIDDGGSGYALGRDILTAVARAADGRGPATELTQPVFRALSVSAVGEMITWLYAPATGKKEIAALAPLLLPALDAGDAAALAIASAAAQELALLACTAWKNLGLDAGELALTGSILQRYEPIRREVLRRCRAAYPHMAVIDPRGSAAMGAARLALELLTAAR